MRKKKFEGFEQVYFVTSKQVKKSKMNYDLYIQKAIQIFSNVSLQRHSMFQRGIQEYDTLEGILSMAEMIFSDQSIKKHLKFREYVLSTAANDNPPEEEPVIEVKQEEKVVEEEIAEIPLGDTDYVWTLPDGSQICYEDGKKISKTKITKIYREWIKWLKLNGNHHMITKLDTFWMSNMTKGDVIKNIWRADLTNREAREMFDRRQ